MNLNKGSIDKAVNRKKNKQKMVLVKQDKPELRGVGEGATWIKILKLSSPKRNR